MTLMTGGAISGYCATGRRAKATRAEDHEHDRDHGGEDRPVDEEVRDAHGAAPSSALACGPALAPARRGALLLRRHLLRRAARASGR